MRDYTSKEYTEFRKQVLKRDRYTCQMPKCCYKNKKFLQVHHVYTWANYPQLRLDPRFSITLCVRCHKSIKNAEEEYAPLFLTILKKYG